MKKQQAQATSNNNIFAQALATLASTQKSARKRDSIIASNASKNIATLVKQRNKNNFVYVLHNAQLLDTQVLQALGITSASTRNRLDKNKAQALLNIASTQPQALDAMHIAIATSATE